MFERFNESARRALFFARYAATQAGAAAISPNHLAEGVLRDTRPEAWSATGASESLERVRESLTRTTSVPHTGSALEIPFTPETKRALTRAAEIADLHGQQAITPMHLLAGVMDFGRDAAAEILRKAGLDPQRVAAAGTSDEAPPTFSSHVRGELTERFVAPEDAGPLALRLFDERAIERLCADLFAATDLKDWDAARAVFADGTILVDMTSLAGGAPVTTTAHELVAGFRQGLHRDKASHHLVSNYRIVFTEAGADVLAHGYAWNRVAALAPNDLWETWGTYKFSVRRTGDGWRVTAFQYVSRLTRGNDAVRTHVP